MRLSTFSVLILGATATFLSPTAHGKDNKSEVQAAIQERYDHVYWGAELNHEKYLELIAAAVTAGPGGVGAVLQDFAKQNAVSIGSDVILDLVLGNTDAVVDGGKTWYGGIATYKQWTVEGGPLFAIKFPRPNTHQLYIAVGKKKNQPNKLLLPGPGTKLYIGSVKANGLLGHDHIIDDNCDARLLAVSGPDIYWVDSGSTKLLHGHVVEHQLRVIRVIDKKCRARILAVSGDEFYWVDANATDLHRGKIKDDGILHSEAVIDPSCKARLLTVDGQKFYWSDFGTTALQIGEVRGGKLHSDKTIDPKFAGRLLSTSADKVFWIDEDSKKLLKGEVDASSRLMRTGMIDDECVAWLLAISGGDYYWLD